MDIPDGRKKVTPTLVAKWKKGQRQKTTKGFGEHSFMTMDIHLYKSVFYCLMINHLRKLQSKYIWMFLNGCACYTVWCCQTNLTYFGCSSVICWKKAWMVKGTGPEVKHSSSWGISSMTGLGFAVMRTSLVVRKDTHPVCIEGCPRKEWSCL